MDKVQNIILIPGLVLNMPSGATIHVVNHIFDLDNMEFVVIAH
jgi:hypothetical protein